MPAKRSPQVHAVANILANLYRIEVLAYAIECMTDGLQVLTGCKSAVEGLISEKANAICQLSGIIRELAARSQNLLLDTEEF